MCVSLFSRFGCRSCQAAFKCTIDHLARARCEGDRKVSVTVASKMRRRPPFQGKRVRPLGSRIDGIDILANACLIMRFTSPALRQHDRLCSNLFGSISLPHLQRYLRRPEVPRQLVKNQSMLRSLFFQNQSLGSLRTSKECPLPLGHFFQTIKSYQTIRQWQYPTPCRKMFLAKRMPILSLISCL